MLSYKEIEVPDIGDFRSVQVIEILVQEGERVEVNTPLIAVKTEKGPMDVPSPLAGKVQEMIVQVEDRVTKGSSILLLETEVEDPVSAPSFSEPTLQSEAGFDPDSDHKVEPLWEIDPIIDPTTTEPRLPSDVVEERDEPVFDDFGERESPTPAEQVEPEDDGSMADSGVYDDVQSAQQASVDEEVSVERDWDEEIEAPLSEGGAHPTDAATVEEEVDADVEIASTIDESVTVLVPDIGDFDDVEVIEVHVSGGDAVELEDPLITLESDKATMDVPATASGVVSEVLVEVGDRVSEGSPIVRVGGAGAEPAAAPVTVAEEHAVAAAESAAAAPIPQARPDPGTRPAARKRSAAGPAAPPVSIDSSRSPDEVPHASPGVRKFARELGADLTKISGSGPKGRILKEDVQRWVKKTLTEKPSAAPAAATGGAGIPEMPDIDFSQFGEIEKQPLSRIKKLTAANLSRAWLNVPHVTQHDEADITELEEFRQELKKEEESRTGARITMLSFLMKACVVALKEYPVFNASLEKGGENLIVKHYYHMGIAVDTNQGLVVPVVRDVDRKTIRDLAGELADISSRARERKLSPKDLQGASFTISSLGGIGGTAFTPIVNAPEVAILGVSRSSMKPVYENGDFVPRLILPISLSYDHRVIDGSQAAHFTSFLARVLADVRRLLL